MASPVCKKLECNAWTARAASLPLLAVMHNSLTNTVDNLCELEKERK